MNARFASVLCFLFAVSFCTAQVGIDTTEVRSIEQDSSKRGKFPVLEQKKGRPQQPKTVTPAQETSEISTSNGIVVEHGADSSRQDIANQLTHLMGNAFVKYEDYEVKADYILLDLKVNEIRASRRSKKLPKVAFKSGDQSVAADELRFNLKTYSGIVYGANIIQNDLYVHGAVTKFRRGANDSLEIEDVVYNRNALITSCDHAHPHWGIRTTKLKMIPDRLAVMGPSYLELAGLPTPIVFPYAFAPFVDLQNASSGVIAPQDFIDFSPRRGIGVRGIGYYFALSDYMDLSVKGNAYTRGSWGLSLASNYKKRYKYSGKVDLGYELLVADVANQVEPSREPTYSVSISHNQDSKAHPYRRFGGSLRFTINDYDRRNFNDAAAQLNSQINSNFNYSYRLSKDWNFSAGLTHSQNTLNRSITFTLPDINLSSQNIYPFKRKNVINEEKWYEKINVRYTGKMRNTVTTQDTLLFRQETLDEFRSGVAHDVTLQASYKMLDYVSFNTSANYDELWYLQTIDAQVDTSGAAVGDVVGGFQAYRGFSFNSGFSTNLFATALFKKGWLRGLRHSAQPTVGIRYAPSTEHFYKEIEIDGVSYQYNPFTTSNSEIASSSEKLFRSQNLQAGAMAITYGIGNTFEGKYFSKRDSTEKKFKIIDNLNISGSYNFQADSLRWSPISFRGNVAIFKNITRLNFSGRFDPYVLNDSNRKVNESVWSQSKLPARLDQFSFDVSTQFTLGDIQSWLSGESDEDRSKRRAKTDRAKSLYPELFSWFENARIQHIFRLGFTDAFDGGSWDVSTHTIQLTTGNIPLSDKWGMSVGNLAYDIKNKRLVYPSFTLRRDLHCWEMNVSWYPASESYSFFIGVKAAPFSQFLKYRSGQDVFDNSRFR